MSYYQDDDYLAYEDEVGNYYYLCRWFEVIRTEKKLETGSDTVFLKCITKSGEKEYSIPSQDMANSQFHKHLMNFGLMISNGDRETVDTILNYAYYSKEYAPYIQTYDSLGFFTSGEETMFLGNSIINVYDKTVKYEGYSYISPDKVLKKGSLKEWVKGVRKLTERTEIALALAIGISAISPPGAPESHTGIAPLRSASDYINLETGKIEYTLPSITTRYIWKLTQKTVSVNGKALSEPAVMMNSTLYLPLRAFANSLAAAKVSYNKATKTATLEMNGLYFTATDGGFVTYANDRPLFSFSPNVLMSNGRMYVPASALTKALGVEIKTQTSSAVSVSGS